MIDWIRRDARTNHLYKWGECSSFMFVMNMHFEIESKRYIYSLLKFWLLMAARWVLTPIYVVGSTTILRDCRDQMNDPDIVFCSYQYRQCLELEAEHHRVNIANSLWFAILAPLLIALFAFTHIEKRESQ